MSQVTPTLDAPILTALSNMFHRLETTHIARVLHRLGRRIEQLRTPEVADGPRLAQGRPGPPPRKSNNSTAPRRRPGFRCATRPDPALSATMIATRPTRKVKGVATMGSWSFVSGGGLCAT
jgi:hypothetical protein